MNEVLPGGAAATHVIAFSIGFGVLVWRDWDSHAEARLPGITGVIAMKRGKR